MEFFARREGYEVSLQRDEIVAVVVDIIFGIHCIRLCLFWRWGSRSGTWYVVSEVFRRAEHTETGAGLGFVFFLF
jgi:hypothetical protein